MAALGIFGVIELLSVLEQHQTAGAATGEQDLKFDDCGGLGVVFGHNPLFSR